MRKIQVFLLGSLWGDLKDAAADPLGPGDPVRRRWFHSRWWEKEGRSMGQQLVIRRPMELPRSGLC